MFILVEDPKTYDEVMRSIDSKFQKEAINDELESIMSICTQILTDLPKGCKPLSSERIFKKKLKADGSIDEVNTRLLVRGNNQKKNIDYFDTYSLVTKVATIRALIALTLLHGLLVHQIDMKTTFLNGDLEEEIYMR